MDQFLSADLDSIAASPAALSSGEQVESKPAELTSAASDNDPFADLPAFETADLDSAAIASSSTASDPLANANLASATAAAEVAGTIASKPAVTQPATDGSAAAPQVVPTQPRPRSWTDRILLRSMPAWMVSMMLHVAILMTLAAIQIEPVRDAIGILMEATASGDDSQGLDESFDVSGPDLETPVAAMAEQSLSTPSEFAPQELSLPTTNALTAATSTQVDVSSTTSLVESVLPSSALSASGARISSALSGRSSGSMRSELLERFGGNAASEKSVAAALRWIATHQDRSGGWNFAHSRICRGECKDDGDAVQATNAATALALLPFLGAGQTHLEGSYKETVYNGLKFLIKRMNVAGGTQPHGSWHEPDGRMYSHGLASIVMCEAYAMTRDPDLLQPAQLALNYIVYAQDPRGGGWRYNPKQPGDTSVVGWQLMAMKSGTMGNLAVPPETFRLANQFLDSVGVNDGAYYGYDQATARIENRHATTAVGLLCRMYLGWPKDRKGIKDGIAFLSKRGPSVDDLYYSYYATQVMRQYGGEEWKKWNTAMRDGLIKAQVPEGHAAGSWFSSKSSHNGKGGRLYCTAMSAMILEVYYRHMPLYTEKSMEDEFEF